MRIDTEYFVNEEAVKCYIKFATKEMKSIGIKTMGFFANYNQENSICAPEKPWVVQAIYLDK
jgi:hypothetical protein